MSGRPLEVDDRAIEGVNYNQEQGRCLKLCEGISNGNGIYKNFFYLKFWSMYIYFKHPCVVSGQPDNYLVKVVKMSGGQAGGEGRMDDRASVLLTLAG